MKIIFCTVFVLLIQNSAQFECPPNSVSLIQDGTAQNMQDCKCNTGYVPVNNKMTNNAPKCEPILCSQSTITCPGPKKSKALTDVCTGNHQRDNTTMLRRDIYSSVRQLVQDSSNWIQGETVGTIPTGLSWNAWPSALTSDHGPPQCEINQDGTAKENGCRDIYT